MSVQGAVTDGRSIDTRVNQEAQRGCRSRGRNGCRFGSPPNRGFGYRCRHHDHPTFIHHAIHDDVADAARARLNGSRTSICARLASCRWPPELPYIPESDVGDADRRQGLVYASQTIFAHRPAHSLLTGK
ncbi:hypothetical protein [Mesorhizobium sp. L-8-10]|uniref:hypothetical protein n=1 Tax=Mesorhizobium sp. L-8-10 TaxID=2744523 RepID=UPI0019275D15|nr:hypothetical protein [Mesorhizobium sp. L-8-10]